MHCLLAVYFIFCWLWCWNVMCESLSFVVYGSKIVNQGGRKHFHYASEGIESRRWFGY